MGFKSLVVVSGLSLLLCSISFAQGPHASQQNTSRPIVEATPVDVDSQTEEVGEAIELLQLVNNRGTGEQPSGFRGSRPSGYSPDSMAEISP